MNPQQQNHNPTQNQSGMRQTPLVKQPTPKGQSITLGIIAIITAVFVPPVGFILGILSVVKGMKGRGTRTPLTIMGYISIVLSLISIVIVLMIAQKIIDSRLDYAKTIPKTVESDGAKVMIDLPKKYTIQSTYKDSESGMDMFVFSNRKIAVKDNKIAPIFGLENGAILVGIDYSYKVDTFNADDMKFYFSDKNERQTFESSFKSNLIKTFEPNCTLASGDNSTVNIPDYTYAEVGVKLSCKSSSSSSPGYTLYAKKRMSFETGAIYLVVATEKQDFYSKHSSEIQKIVNTAKFE